MLSFCIFFDWVNIARKIDLDDILENLMYYLQGSFLFIYLFIFLKEMSLCFI